MAENEVPALHRQDHGPDSDRTAFCAGALSTAANACIMPHNSPGAPEARLKVGPNKACFPHPRDFYRHHTGREWVPPVIPRLEARR